MKAYRIRWSDRASTELYEICAYLGGLADEVDRAAEMLSANPESAPRAWKRGKRHPRIRRLILVRCPYHLYYRVDHVAEEIEILSVWHEKRRPPKL